MRPLLAAALLAAAPAWGQGADKPPSGSAPGGWLPRTTAELTVLDKVRAQAVPLSVRSGASGTSGSLTITVRGCFVRPADQPADSAAFLDIQDSRPTGTGFRGWMLAGAPSLNQMQHPIYDVRVVACR
jgi:hypothetical protein